MTPLKIILKKKLFVNSITNGSRIKMVQHVKKNEKRTQLYNRNVAKVSIVKWSQNWIFVDRRLYHNKNPLTEHQCTVACKINFSVGTSVIAFGYFFRAVFLTNLVIRYVIKQIFVMFETKKMQ